MADESPKRLRWQDLSGQERYRVIELLRRGEVAVKELCQTFGVSRQTLYRAAEAADQASVAALGPKRRGRKPEPATQKQLRRIEAEKVQLEKELERMRQRCEISQALLDLQRKAERGDGLPGEKKTLRTAKRLAQGGVGPSRTKPTMAGTDDGRGAGGQSGGADELDQASPGRRGNE